MSIRHRLKLLVGNRKSQSLCALGVVVIALGVFSFAHPTHAWTGQETLQNIIGSILEFFIWAIGSLLFMVMKALISIAQYNHFVDSHTVELGWAIVRDLTNMFFVLLMLIVAFSTILGVPKDYVWTAVLPRLLVMAVLINFSKVIVGLLVDFSQVVMMTFVNGFSAAAGANMVNMLGIRNTVGFSASASPIGVWDTLAAQFLAVVMLGLSLAAVVMFMLMLVSRIVMIWILTILSPLAFFLSAVPSSRAKSQYAEWWKMLGEYLVAGPVLAFFLWLSFAVAGSGNLAEQEGFQPLPAGSAAVSREGGIRTLAGQEGNFISYVVGLALLMGGMTITSKFNVIGGKALGGAVDWVKNKGTSFAKGAAKAPFRALGAGAGFIGKEADSRIYAATGIGLDPRRYISGIKKGYKERMEDREKKGQGVVAAAQKAGGWRGKYVAPLLGRPDQFVREHGVLGVPYLAGKGALGLGRVGIATAANKIGAGANMLGAKLGKDVNFRTTWGAKVAPRATEAYTKQFDETQAKRREVQGKLDEKKANYNAAQKKVDTIQSDLGQNEDTEKQAQVDLAAAMKKRQALSSKLMGQRQVGAPQAMIDQTIDERSAADAEIVAAKEKLTTLDAGKQAMYQDLNRAQQNLASLRPEASSKEVTDLEKEDATLAKREQFLREKANASRPKGGIGELPKHKLQVEDLKVALDQSIGEEDAAGIQSVMRKASTDGMLGDLLRQYQRKNEKNESVPYGADSRGFENFSKEVLQGKGKMGAQDTLALADEISSLHKGESAAFANMTKASAGGQRRWSTLDEREAATAADLGRGDVNEKLKKGSANMIGTTNDQGKFEMPASAQSFIARFAETLAKRMDRSSGGTPLVGRGIMEKMAANGEAILKTMENLQKQGVISQQKYDAIKSAVGKAKTLVAAEAGGGPAKIDDLAKAILRLQEKNPPT